jgi:hypothetical protein
LIAKAKGHRTHGAFFRENPSQISNEADVILSSFQLISGRNQII